MTGTRDPMRGKYQGKLLGYNLVRVPARTRGKHASQTIAVPESVRIRMETVPKDRLRIRIPGPVTGFIAGNGQSRSPRGGSCTA